ncbi:dihydropteroate synthase [Acetobacteraceae bacterium]|nr:dihydropteroate synthase [Acetobacteraceae bacterium]
MLKKLINGQDFILPKLMGILNVTPDSFSDGGRFFSPKTALAQAKNLLLEGADILDVGAESTRPHFIPLSAQKEIERLRPVLSLLKAENITFSIDTYKSETASFALSYGAEIINDVGGLQTDPHMAFAITKHTQSTGQCPSIVVMQSLPQANASFPLKEQFQIFFEKSLAIAKKAGIPQEKLILDPGIGFGKTPEQNMECLSLIPFLKQTYHLPVLIGLSKKRFLEKFSPHPQAASERLPATLSADLFAALKGADILRVHDILAHKTFLHLFQALYHQESTAP